jgi:hypothetical protein
MKFPGVSVITIGPALGHDTEIDATTLEQVCQLGNSAAPVKVFPDHDESVTDLIGAMSNFRIEGEQVRADMELIGEHPLANYYSKILDIFPDSLGFSISWLGSCVEKAGAKFARVAELLSVDLVSRAAANPSGVYSSRSVLKKLAAKTEEKKQDAPAFVPDEGMADSLPVDSEKSLPMAQDQVNPAQEALAADPISAALAPITEAIKALSDKLDAFIAQDPVDDQKAIDDAIAAEEKTEMSAKLDAVITKLSILEEAGRGTEAVASEPSGENLVARFEALASDKERVAFARQHPEIRSLLKPAHK